jgi:hypothetical protein
MTLQSNRVAALCLTLLPLVGCSDTSAVTSQGSTTSIPSVGSTDQRVGRLDPPQLTRYAIQVTPRQAAGAAPQAGTTPRLYISDYNNGVVNVYSQKGPGQSPIAQITGLSSPAGLAVAKNGDLFVYNDGNSTITVYHRGSLTPFETLTGSRGFGLAVDSHENVYATIFQSGSNGSTINVYAAGSTTPTSTLTDPLIGGLQSIAVDLKGSVFVVGFNYAYFRFEVDEFPQGKPKVKALPIPLRYFYGAANLDGLAVDDSNGDLIVEDSNIKPNPTISVYAPPYTIFPVSRFSFNGWAPAIALSKSTTDVWLANDSASQSLPEGQKYALATGTLLDATSTKDLSLSYGIAVDPI